MSTLPSPPVQLDVFADGLLNRMKSQLDLLMEETLDEVSRIQQSRQVVYTILCDLRSFVHTYSFKNTDEEIRFFRHSKPFITSRFLYFQTRLEIKLHEPILEEARKRFLETRLLNLQAFQYQHNAFYMYCVSAETCFDTQYFTRQSVFQNPDLDKTFSTGYDSLYATLLANEEVKKFLVNQLYASGMNDHQSSLTWTSSKAALIELVYSLKATEVFNDGKADLKQIATTLENLFHVSLGNYYRVYQDIRLRKSGQANFLDLLKEKFIARISELD
ncbi:MAG: RteC domain-containing protein [Cyclobacteriaceae bacterium]